MIDQGRYSSPSILIPSSTSGGAPLGRCVRGIVTKTASKSLCMTQSWTHEDVCRRARSPLGLETCVFRTLALVRLSGP